MPEETPPQPPALHRHRQIAESFGANPELYDRVRPAYPDGLIAQVLAGVTGRGVLDVGCGTGIAARQFQAVGCSVLGVEPDVRMAAYAQSRGLEVEVATFEEWDAAGRTYDVVTAAQSWQWVDPAAGALKAAGVLRRGGRLAVFGHVFEPPEHVAAAFAEAFRRELPDSPFSGQRRPTLDVYQAAYAKIAGRFRDSGAFDQVDQWRFDWTKNYTRDEWLGLLPTTGGLTRLSAHRLAPILTSVGEAIDAHGGAFTMDYVTLAATGLRRD